jgi:hypothetical protein
MGGRKEMQATEIYVRRVFNEYNGTRYLSNIGSQIFSQPLFSLYERAYCGKIFI